MDNFVTITDSLGKTHTIDVSNELSYCILTGSNSSLIVVDGAGIMHDIKVREDSAALDIPMYINSIQVCRTNFRDLVSWLKENVFAAATGGDHTDREPIPMIPTDKNSCETCAYEKQVPECMRECDDYTPKVSPEVK